jgi:hypothetical protein
MLPEINASEANYRGHCKQPVQLPKVDDPGGTRS